MKIINSTKIIKIYKIYKKIFDFNNMISEKHILYGILTGACIYHCYKCLYKKKCIIVVDLKKPIKIIKKRKKPIMPTRSPPFIIKTLSTPVVVPSIIFQQVSDELIYDPIIIMVA